MIDFALVFGSFLLTALLMGRVIAWSKSFGLIDEVNKRSSHKEPTPRGGGIIIVLMTLLAGIVYTGYLMKSADGAVPWFLIALLGGGALVAFVGLMDDKHGLSAKVRLLSQVVAVAPVVYFLPHIMTFMPVWADKAIFFFLWIWFINLYNFMDGIDGLAGAQAVFLGAAMSLFSPFFKPIALVIAGSSMGFLRVNVSVKRPAKIFMGDVGSTFLGYMFAGLIFYSATWDTLLAFLALTLVFSGDATFTLIKRLMQGKKPWHAHKEHFYQRAVHNVGMSHTDVVVKATFVNTALLVAVMVGLVSGFGPWVFVVGLAIVAYPAHRISKLEGK
ncbi:MAG: glycosyltransferase family 4 protein [Pseudomonadota bacterium]|nr:glycosyltransferase family 4 protein [Pseudomonadota bacterium]